MHILFQHDCINSAKQQQQNWFDTTECVKAHNL